MNERQLKTLRQYITEAVTITISGDHGEPVARELAIDDEDLDELYHFLDRYTYKPKWVSKRASLKSAPPEGREAIKLQREKEKNDTEAESSRQAEGGRQIVDEIVKMTGTDLSRDELFAVAAQWGTLGFDALSKIKTAQKRTGLAFPFFANRNPNLGTKIPFPVAPSVRAVDDIIEIKTSTGIGSGEIMISFLTGGKKISAGKDKEGDIEIGSVAWEIKDIRGQESPRLGGAATKLFKPELENAYKKLSREDIPLDEEAQPMSFQKFMSSLNSYQWERSDAVYGMLDAAVHKATEGLGGYILLHGDTFHFVKTSDAVFQAVTSGRIVVDFPSVTGKNAVSARAQRLATQDSPTASKPENKKTK